MILGFPSHNLGEMDFPSHVDRSDRHMDLSKMRNLFSYVGSSPFIPIIRKSSIICEYLCLWGFRFGVFSLIAMFFSHSNYCVLVIHDLVVHLVRGGKLLENRDPEHPM